MIGRLFGPVHFPLFSEDIIKFISCASIAAINNDFHFDDEGNLKIIYLKTWYWLKFFLELNKNSH